jgi:hypothetical protein
VSAQKEVDQVRQQQVIHQRRLERRVRATFASGNRKHLVNRIIRCGLASTVLATVLMTNAEAEDPVVRICENAVNGAGDLPRVAALDFAIVHWLFTTQLNLSTAAPGHITPWRVTQPAR